MAAIYVDWLFTDILEKEEFSQQIQKYFPDDVREHDGSLTMIRGTSFDENIQRLTEIRRYFMEEFRTISDEDFLRVRHLSDFHVTPPWTIHQLIQHEAEHRCEIMVIIEARKKFLNAD